MAKTKKNNAPRGSGNTFLWGWLLFLSSCMLTVYWVTLPFPFVFDDYPFIVENGAMRGSFLELWFFNPSRIFSNASIAITMSIHGLNESMMRFWGLLLHIANVFLLVLIMRRLPGLNTLIAFLLVPGVFSLHTLQTQAVVYIWQRSVLLAAFFSLLAIFLWLLSRDGDPLRVRIYRGLSLAMVIAAMLSKEIAFVLPLMILWIDRCFPGQNGPRPLREFWPFAITMSLIPLLTLYSATRISEVLPNHMRIEPLAYLLTQPEVFLRYVWLMIVPVGQNVDHDISLVNSVLAFRFWASSLLCCALLGTGFWLYKRARVLSFGIVWLFLGLSVEAVAFILPDVMFEHRVYLSMIGFAVILTQLLEQLPKKVGVVVSILILGVLLQMSRARVEVWRSELILWEDAANKSPEKPRTILNRGAAKYRLGELNGALKDIDRAIELDPNYEKAYRARGTIYFQGKQLDEALKDFDRVLAITPADGIISNSRGVIHLRKGHLEKAKQDFLAAIKARPDDPIPQNNLGLVMGRLDEHETAVIHFKEALRLKRSYAQAAYNLGRSYEKLEQRHQAKQAYTQAIHQNPKHRKAIEALVQLLEKEGDHEQAKILRGKL